MNQVDIIQMIRNGQNPQQITMNILESRLGNTPMGSNLISLARANKTAEIEQIARNLMAQRGLDYDKELIAFKDNLGLK